MAAMKRQVAAGTWHVPLTAWQNVPPFWLSTRFAEHPKKKWLWDWTACRHCLAGIAALGSPLVGAVEG
jgi:hypothetical protein